MTIQNIINRKPEAVQFLIMAMLSDTYSALGLDTFLEVFQNKVTKQEVEELRHATGVKVESDFKKELGESRLNLSIKFLGHGGYPGGEFSKDLKTVDVEVDALTLVYLMSTMQKEMNQAEKEYYETLESGNAE